MKENANKSRIVKTTINNITISLSLGCIKMNM